MARMVAHFLAGPLIREHIAQAFPLISLEVPGLTIDRWQAFARARMRSEHWKGDRGILTVRNPAGYIHGLAVYKVEDDLRHGRALMANPVVTARSAGSGEVVAVLIEAMGKVARDCDCVSIHASLPALSRLPAGEDHWMARRFRDAGFEMRMIPIDRKSVV